MDTTNDKAQGKKRWGSPLRIKEDTHKQIKETAARQDREIYKVVDDAVSNYIEMLKQLSKDLFLLWVQPHTYYLVLEMARREGVKEYELVDKAIRFYDSRERGTDGR